MPGEYFEEENPLRVSRGGMFSGSVWKQLLADHLRDCYRQRRVFREALNDVRSEMLSEIGRMHKENQSKMESMSEQMSLGQGKIEALQKWIFGGVISTLAAMLVYFITHFGPLAVR